MRPRISLITVFVVVNIALAGCASFSDAQTTSSETTITTTTTPVKSTKITTTTTSTTSTTRATLTERTPHFRFQVIAQGEFNATITIVRAESENRTVVYNETHHMTNLSTVSLGDTLRMDTKYNASIEVDGAEAWNGTLLPTYGYRLKVHPDGTVDVYWETG